LIKQIAYNGGRMSEVPRRGIWASAVHQLDSRSGASLIEDAQTFLSSIYPSSEALAHPPADSQNVNAVALLSPLYYPPTPRLSIALLIAAMPGIQAKRHFGYLVHIRQCRFLSIFGMIDDSVVYPYL